MCVGGGDLGVSGLLERWRRERCISLEYAQVFIFMHRAVLLLLLVMLGCCMSYFMYIQYICIEPSVLCKHAATSTTTDEAITGCKEKQTQTYSTVQLSTPPQKLKLSLHPSVFFFCFFFTVIHKQTASPQSSSLYFHCSGSKCVWWERMGCMHRWALQPSTLRLWFTLTVVINLVSSSSRQLLSLAELW